MFVMLAAFAAAPACDTLLFTGEHRPSSGMGGSSGLGTGGSGGLGTGGSGGGTVDAAPDLPPPRDSSPTDASPPRDASDASDASGAITQLLHDMEDDRLNFVSPLVLGSWFAMINYADGRAPLPLERLIEPIVPPRGSSQRACHMRAGRYEDGVDLFVDFHPIGGQPTFNHADLSAYLGLVFWARSDSSDRLVVAAADSSVNVQEEFWKSELEGRPWPARLISLTTRWERYVLLFEDLRGGLNTTPIAPRPLNTAAINSFHFLSGVGGTPVDFWIDDLALLCRGFCP
jgi:hypothetical protein